MYNMWSYLEKSLTQCVCAHVKKFFYPFSYCTFFIQNGLWAGVTNDPNPQLKVHVCPIPYCHCSDDDVTCDSLYYHDDPNENKQCHNFREGTT